MNLLGTHLLSVGQFDRDGVERLLDVARTAEPIARRRKVCRILEGAVLGNLFFEPSTRTRISFGAAFCRLGGAVCDTTGFTFSSMVKGESIYDTSRVISGYVDAIVIRHPEKGAVAEFARATNVPVVNGGDGPGEHPSQALLDLYAIKNEFERLDKTIDGASIALIGDLKYGRTVHSLIRLLSLYRGIRFYLISPVGLEMPGEICDEVASCGHHLEVRHVLRRTLSPVDLIYATRIQKERLSAEEIAHYPADFQVNASFLEQHCESSTIVMHPLPRDSSDGAFDLSIDLNGDSRLAIFRQSDSGVAVRMAIFAMLLGVEGNIERYTRECAWWRPDLIGPDDASFYRLP